MKLADAIAYLNAQGCPEGASILEGMPKQKRRAPRRSTSQPLTAEVAAEIKRLHRTTQMSNHNIAARLNLNPGRVAEVLTGQKFAGVA